MEQLEQLAMAIIFIVIGVGATFISYLAKKVKRLEYKISDETFERLKKEAKDALSNKSNSQLIDDANNRYGGSSEDS